MIKPLFPLSIIAFPGERVNLHIFEPRYRQLFAECEQEGITFIICPHYNGKNYNYGTEMKLIKIDKRYPNGKLDVKTEGIGLVKIEAFYKNIIDKLYGGAEVIPQAWDDNSNPLLSKEIIKKLRILYSSSDINNITVGSVSSFKTYHVAHKVGFSVEQELTFLKIGKEIDRQVFMLGHLKKILPILNEIAQLKLKAAMNGHFKNLPPIDWK